MSPRSSKKLVAFVGRPNVGKSTMFNLLARSRRAIVEDTPGLTRDRNYAEVSYDDKEFTVVDTGGFEPETDDIILTQMRTQTMVAIEQADIIVFLADGKAGLTPSDTEIVRTLQRADKRVFYAVNKIDSEKQEGNALEFHALGLDEIYTVSAMTGYGMNELLEAVASEIPDSPPKETEESSDEEKTPRIAVVGRPNVGKSTLINLLLGEERLVANPQPGTTRDSIDTIVKHYGKEYLFVDTAGIRRRSRIVDRIEKYSVIKAFQSIDRADIALMMIDATEPVTDQDARIAGYAHRRGRGVALILNKWDLISKDNKTHDKYIQMVRDHLKYLDHAPILTISATEGTRAIKLFGVIEQLCEQYRKRVPTADLNRFIQEVTAGHPPGMHKSSKRIKILFGTQVRVAPPTFVLFCNFPESVHFSYQRFILNRLRERFGFGGSPLRLYLRRRHKKDSD